MFTDPCTILILQPSLLQRVHVAIDGSYKSQIIWLFFTNATKAQTHLGLCYDLTQLTQTNNSVFDSSSGFKSYSLLSLPVLQNFGLDYHTFQHMVGDCPSDFLQLAFNCCNVSPLNPLALCPPVTSKGPGRCSYKFLEMGPAQVAHLSALIVIC